MYHILIKFFPIRYLIVVAGLLIGSESYAQINKIKSKIDSLTNLTNSSSGLARFDPTYELIFEYLEIDLNKSLDYANSALIISLEFGDSLKIVKSSRVKAYVLRKVERTNEAIVEYQKILPVAKRNNFTSEYILILNSLALAYTFVADYDKALDYNFQCLLLRQKEGIKKDISASYNNIGLVFYKLKNFDKALENYEQALKLENVIENSYFKDRLLINIALCYNHLHNYKEARKFVNEGLRFCSPNCNNSTVLEGEFTLGASYYGEKSYPKALRHFKTALQLAILNADKRFQSESYNFLARINVRTNTLDSATFFLSKAEEIALESDYNEVLIETYKIFSELYSNSKNYQQSSFYQNKYIKLKDSIYSESLIDNLAKVQTEYAERKNIATIADKEEIIQRQRSLNVAIVIIALLAALLIFVLYRSNMVKKKVNTALSDAKAIIEDQNLLLLNSNIDLDKELKVKNIDLEKANESLRRVNDELDNFIYKTSHDIRGPLASLKGMCNVALMDVKDETALGYLKKLDITAEKLNTILTRLLIVNQINNSALHSVKIDFHQIVQELLLLETKKGMPSRLMVRKKIDPDIEFYSDKEFTRIILENLVDNAIKFYNDSQRVEPFVDITITMEAESVLIRVVDNGIGISQAHPDKIFQMFSRASERSETGGIGLYITKTAVEKLGGTINLRITPEGYTEFHVNLPLTIQKVEA